MATTASTPARMYVLLRLDGRVEILELDAQFVGLEFFSSCLLHGTGRLGGSEGFRVNGLMITWMLV